MYYKWFYTEDTGHVKHVCYIQSEILRCAMNIDDSCAHTFFFFLPGIIRSKHPKSTNINSFWMFVHSQVTRNPGRFQAGRVRFLVAYEPNSCYHLTRQTKLWHLLFPVPCGVSRFENRYVSSVSSSITVSIYIFSYMPEVLGGQMLLWSSCVINNTNIARSRSWNHQKETSLLELHLNNLCFTVNKQCFFFFWNPPKQLLCTELLIYLLYLLHVCVCARSSALSGHLTDIILRYPVAQGKVRGRVVIQSVVI